MSSPRLPLLLLATLITACSGAASAPMAPASPAAKGAPTSATAAPSATPEEAGDPALGGASGGQPPKPLAAATDVDKGAGGGEKKPSPTGGAARSTSPTNDPGHDDPSANPPSRRLEDVKNEKQTGASGSYSMAVKSAVGVNPDEVGKAINGAAPKADACYAKLLKKKPATGSQTTFGVEIDGKNTTIKVSADTIKDADWSKCLEAALKTVTWPAAASGKGKTVIEFLLQ